MEWIMGAFSWVGQNSLVLLEVIGALAMLAQVTPNTADDRFVQFMLDAINFGAGNNGKSRNA